MYSEEKKEIIYSLYETFSGSTEMTGEENKVMGNLYRKVKELSGDTIPKDIDEAIGNYASMQFNAGLVLGYRLAMKVIFAGT